MTATYTQLLRELLIERRKLYERLRNEGESVKDASKWEQLDDCCSEIIDDIDSESPKTE